MAVDAGPGPDRESADLAKWEAGIFCMITEANTYADVRFQLSYALKQRTQPASVTVLDGFQRNARRMWRPSAGTAL